MTKNSPKKLLRYFVTLLPRYLTIFATLILLFLLTHDSRLPPEALAKWGLTTQIHAATFPTQSTNLWYPYVEWEINNVSYSDNPFDVKATVTFDHQGSNAQHTTQMFYDGGNTWKFRFTGTKTGTWTFTTQSSNSQLNGHTGTINVNPPNSNARGFLLAHGNKFAVQTGENQIKGHVFNVFMNLSQVDTNIYDYEIPETLEIAMQEAENNGSNSIYVFLANYWFKFGSLAYGHGSEDPDPRTFRMLENMITTAHERGINIHIWAWGDEDRRWTPIGVGGINGIPDKRVQRYIAARLGPLPGWTMSYAFDLFEWVSQDQTRVWADYMHQHLGWPRLLMAREESHYKTPENMDVFSTDERVSSGFYNNAVSLLSNSSNRPVIYERRFTYMRDNVWTMDNTRRAKWQFTMAGGAAGFWGFFKNSPYPYPNPEQLRTHRQFWQNRFLLDMNRDNSYASGWYGLKTPDNKNIVLYRESVNSLSFTPPTASVGLPIIGVNTRNAYSEINLGTVQSGTNIINLPTSSDWAIAIGNFDSTTPPPTPAPTPTPAPSPTLGPTPTPAPSPTHVPGTVVVSNLSRPGYTAVVGGLSLGEPIYTDRDFSFSSIPDYIAGHTYVMTRNADKQITGNDFLSFTVDQPVTVYVGRDVRISTDVLPEWLQSYTLVDQGNNPDSLKSTDTTFRLYSKTYPQGQITLGGNHGESNHSMYTIALLPQDTQLPTYSQLIQAFGTTTNPQADLNQDGVVNIFDINIWISQTH